MYVSKKRLDQMSDYDKYRHYCDVYGIKPESKKVYEVSIKLAKERGKDISPAEFARRQFHDDLSDKEVMARYKVAKNTAELLGKDLTLSEFMKNKGWQQIDEMASNIYQAEKARLYALYREQGFSEAQAMKYAMEQAHRYVSYQVYGSEF